MSNKPVRAVKSPQSSDLENQITVNLVKFVINEFIRLVFCTICIILGTAVLTFLCAYLHTMYGIEVEPEVHIINSISSLSILGRYLMSILQTAIIGYKSFKKDFI